MSQKYQLFEPMINVSDQHHQYAFGRPLRPISMKSDILSQSLYFNFVTKKRNMKLTPNLFGVTSGCHTTTTTNNDCTASGTATCWQYFSKKIYFFKKYFFINWEYIIFQRYFLANRENNSPKKYYFAHPWLLY